MRLTTETDPAEEAIQAAITWKDKLWEWVTNLDMWEMVLFSALRILLIFILTRIFIRIIYRLIDNSLKRREKGRLKVNPRRFITVGELLKNMTWITSNFIMVMLVLGEFGFKLAPLLTGAGVLGLAIGFGAQSLVKDVITGFFIILEDQFAVGDVIQTGSLKGTVEMIGLRSTRLVSWTGEVHIIPNGMITNVTNYSLNNALIIVDLPFSNSKRLEDSVHLLKKAMLKMKEDHPHLLEVPHVLGIQSLSASEFVIRIAMESTSNAREEVERQIQTYAKQALEEAEALELGRGD
ncbi:mechanosensitive ion channel family protein [Paenibacillus fonticola]|uniref:mechanosensitive ion channel family protein n=1 Tax=Paenibacillus fonticola TaxID=379896 RepID=UPI000375AA60|nr:mechanosensitive ion channel family protein [Paenibacillus fonticola]